MGKHPHQLDLFEERPPQVMAARMTIDNFQKIMFALSRLPDPYDVSYSVDGDKMTITKRLEGGMFERYHGIRHDWLVFDRDGGVSVMSYEEFERKYQHVQ